MLVLSLLLSEAVCVQALEESGITRNFSNVTLIEVLNEVENEYQYSVIYKKDEVNEEKRVSRNFENATLEQVLSEVLGDDLDFRIDGKMIVISKANSGENIIPQQIQRHTVTGVVRDDDGVPVIGANVVEKGTGNGTITDMDGKYVLQVADGATLQVSYIGYRTEEVKVDGKGTIDIC